MAEHDLREPVSGEFVVRVGASGEGAYVAQFFGNEEVEDTGSGEGATVAEALEAALRDYLNEIGPVRAGRQVAREE